MERITRKHLDALVARINRETGSPAEPWTRTEDGRNVANVGNYHLSGAYGGWCLHRMTNEHGGVETPIVWGHVPARELYNRMHAFLSGYTAGKSAASR